MMMDANGSRLLVEHEVTVMVEEPGTRGGHEPGGRGGHEPGGHGGHEPGGHGGHEPVMLARVVELLAVREGGPAVLVDATVGAGGHAAALLAASDSSVHLVGLDRDPDALDLAREHLSRYSDRVHLVQAPYDRLATVVPPVINEVGPLVGVLYDLGVSSMQLDRPERGFSFRDSGPLDMRMDPTTDRTAADLVNHADAAELADIIRMFGEERYARRVAEAIVRARPLRTTQELADVVTAAVPPGTPLRYGRALHPATRTFQALRIAVNEELDRFSASLPQALELLAPPAVSFPRRRGGRVAILSYHSLEDRIAKRVLADATTGCICPPQLPVCGCGRVPLARLLTRGAERPGEDEITRNPRARAAKLRAAEKILAGNAQDAGDT